MATNLEFINKKNDKINVFVIERGMPERRDLPHVKLWKFEVKKSLGHDLYQGMVVSAATFEEASELFLKLLRKDTSSSYEYEGSEWYCAAEAIDLYPEREDKYVLTDFLHP